jgi:hypothetical protein
LKAGFVETFASRRKDIISTKPPLRRELQGCQDNCCLMLNLETSRHVPLRQMRKAQRTRAMARCDTRCFEEAPARYRQSCLACCPGIWRFELPEPIYQMMVEMVSRAEAGLRPSLGFRNLGADQ